MLDLRIIFGKSLSLWKWSSGKSLWDLKKYSPLHHATSYHNIPQYNNTNPHQIIPHHTTTHQTTPLHHPTEQYTTPSPALFFTLVWYNMAWTNFYWEGLAFTHVESEYNSVGESLQMIYLLWNAGLQFVCWSMQNAAGFAIMLKMWDVANNW